jgi:dTDP-4-amino-4,6-dideoxygalactose transaminase/dienelactone hydrolase
MQQTRIDRLAAEPPRRAGEVPPRALVARLVAAHQEPARTVTSAPVTVGGLRGHACELAHPGRSEIRATLLLPDGPGPFPAVLVAPGRNATLERVTGQTPPDHPDRNVAEQLAHSGLATLTVDYGLGHDAGATLNALATLGGGSLLAALVEDAVAALRWLRARPEIDAGRIGLFGHSLGAAVALHTALVEEQPLPVCAASHLGTYRMLYGRLRTGPEGGALPGILQQADLPDLYAALAPAPLQVQYGLRDPYLDRADAAAAGDLVIAGYDRAGAKDRVEVRALDMGHGTDIPGAAAFFAVAFDRPSAGPPPVPAGRVVFDPVARTEVLHRVDAALATGALTLGPYGRQVEELAQDIVGVPVAAVSSGSSALEAALRIIGVTGRTVLVQSNTFFATAASAIRAGATVGFVDIELDGLGMSPEDLRRQLDRPDVAAVVPVHIAGVPSPALGEVLAECAARSIPVVEDAAHALGASVGGRAAGSLGRFGAFSLYPTKVVTSGEGGLVSCADPADLEAVQRYRDQGKASFTANEHAVLGSNWRMSEVHAAVGIAHLSRIDAMLAERRDLAARYDALLDGVPGIRPYRVPVGVVANYYKYVAFLDDDVDREELRRRLRERHGVALAGGVYDMLAPAQPYFEGRFSIAAYPNARWFAGRHVCLPLFPGLTADQQAAAVAGLRAELA